MGLAFELLVMLVLVLVNGVLSGAEIAIVSIRKTRLQELVARGSRAALAVQRLREQPEGFLATVQIGITVVGATAAAFGGSNFAADISPVLVPYFGEHAHLVALVLVVTLISFLSLVLGELVPKSLALKSAERYALLMGRPLLVLAALARPLVWLLTASSNLVLRAFRDTTSFTESRISSGELEQLVKEAADAGTVNPQAGEIAARALGFSKLRAIDVMIPRGAVTSVALDSSPEELRRALVGQPHTRVPVYQGQVDRVVGYVNIKDLLGPVWAQGPLRLEQLLRKPLFVPAFKPALELLEQMRERHTPLAIVMEEDGRFSGLIALDDLVEELIGEVLDEHAVRKESFRREPDGTVLVQGSALVREVNRALGLSLPEGEGWTTVAGMVLERTTTIPTTGAELTLSDGTHVEVIDASPRRVRLVRLRAP